MSFNGSIPTSGANVTAQQFAQDVNAEIQELYKRAPMLLGSVSAGPNAIAAAASPTLTALVDGMSFWLVPQANNTGNVTLNIDGLGAVGLKTASGADIPAGDLVGGVPVKVLYLDGVMYLAGGAGGSGVAAPSATLLQTLAITSGSAVDSSTINPAALKSAGYRNLVIRLANYSTTGGVVRIQMSSNNGENWTPSVGTITGGGVHRSVATLGTMAAADLGIAVFLDAAIANQGAVTIFDFAQSETGLPKSFMSSFDWGDNRDGQVSGHVVGLGAINRLRFETSSGTFDGSGSVAIYAA